MIGLEWKLERWQWLGSAAVVGLCVGSFLNVAIHRYGREGQSIGKPRRSYCPHCKATLGWAENLPLISYLIQGGRCRHCRAPISWRYPLVELLTALLWLAAAWRAEPAAWPLALVQCVVLSGLVVATFVDFDCFEIPDGVSIGGMFAAPLASLAVPALHVDSPFAIWLAGPGLEPGRLESLWVCLAGMLSGGGVLLAVGWLGRLAFRREAMGLGDVKLLAAAGGFLGPGAVLGSLVIASLLASIAGVGRMLGFAWVSAARARRRSGNSRWRRALRIGHLFGRYLPFGPYLGMGIGIALLAWNDVVRWVVSRM